MGLSKGQTTAQSSQHDAADATEALLMCYDEPTEGVRHHMNEADSPAAPDQQAHVDLGWQFVRRLCVILRVVQAAPALSLVVLSIFEAIIVSKIGTISSLFYQVFVDGEQSKVLHLMIWSTGCYVATAMFYTIKISLQDFFSWRWRASLTNHLQQVYCSNLAFYKIKGIDNPDQRIAQDLPLLTQCLSETLSVLAAAPFNVIWYTGLTQQVFGSWCPVAAAYLFFVFGAVLQRVLMLPVASMVYKQEAAEGALRRAHVRMRTAAEEIAMYRSSSLEHGHLTVQLSQVLLCQGRLMLRRAALTAATKLLEYGGLIVNFSCLAVAVFGGSWQDGGSTAGGVAAKVSVASFYLLTLIYSFTQVLDLSSKVSDLAGLTARVSQLYEELNRHQQQQQQQQCTGAAAAAAQGNYQATRISHEWEYQQQQQQQYLQAMHLLNDQPSDAFSHQRYASQATMLLPPQLLLINAQQRDSDSGSSSDNAQQQQHGADMMQISMHSLGSDDLLHRVRCAFPDAPRLAPLTAVVTFQFYEPVQQQLMLQCTQQQQQQQGIVNCGHSSSGSDGSSTSSLPSSECMQHKLQVFLDWQTRMHTYITQRGYWCDVIDPRTGHALHGAAAAAAAYDEVIGAQVLLGYHKQQQQQQGDESISCSLVHHPLAGTQVYPATLFSSAPLPLLKAALHAAGCHSMHTPHNTSSSSALGLGYNGHLPSQSVPPAAAAVTAGVNNSSSPVTTSLLSCDNLTVYTPSGSLIVRDLTLSLTVPSGAAGAAAAAATPAGQNILTVPNSHPDRDLNSHILPNITSVLIRGPSGCGKTTLLKCLAGLWQQQAGTFSITAAAAAAAVMEGDESFSRSSSSSSDNSVMFVPQRCIAAPGATLRAQLLYPTAGSSRCCCCGGGNCKGCVTSSRSDNNSNRVNPAVHSKTLLSRFLRYNGSSSNGYEKVPAAEETAADEEDMEQQQRQRQPAAVSRNWWYDWLTCGVLQNAQQQQQQQCTHSANARCAFCDQLLCSVLDQVGLSYLLKTLPLGLDTAADDWSIVLSPGEMQRVAFAHVLLQKPLLAVLDEATSALPAAAAAELYWELQRAGVNYVSVSHSESLVSVHGRVLEIAADSEGGWRLI